MSFEVKFSPIVIKHLGINMYSTLPPVLAELITNSYDADATEVIVSIDQNKKSIEILDDGCGMSADELNNDFLKIGRNRRNVKPSHKSKYNRAVTGKKGLGKLSVFGICKSIYVESCQDGHINAFELNYDLLLKQGEDDKPLKIDAKIDNEKTNKKSYTKIILKNLIRKSKIPVLNTTNSLLNRLNVFSENFKAQLKDEKDNEELTKKKRNELIYKDKQFDWKIPESLEKIKIPKDTIQYFIDNKITGHIFTTKEILKDSLTGVTLFARNKLANNPEFFGVKVSNSHAYSYMSGELHVNFIDNDEEEDNISTARNSLIWENDSMKELKKHLEVLVRKLGTEWKDLRREKKKEILKKDFDIDIDWYKTTIQSKQDKKLAKKITDMVISSELDATKTKDLLNYVEGAFEFEVFRDYADEIEGNIDGDKLLKLLQDWEVIEAKEHYRLALGRVETIEKFQKLIKEDTLEVGGIDSMHIFLNTFPWILEPRISSFDDEKTYKQILEDKFPVDTKLEVKDRRVDFICKSFGDTIYILEIKRSQKTINDSDLNQLQNYYTFIDANIKENNSDRSKLMNVKAYIIGKKLADNSFVRSKITTLEKSDMYFLSYDEMLGQAKEYHKEFIEAYEKTNNLKKLNSDN